MFRNVLLLIIIQLLFSFQKLNAETIQLGLINDVKNNAPYYENFLKELAKISGIEIKIVYYNAEDGIELLKNKKIDGDSFRVGLTSEQYPELIKLSPSITNVEYGLYQSNIIDDFKSDSFDNSKVVTGVAGNILNQVVAQKFNIEIDFKVKSYTQLQKIFINQKSDFYILISPFYQSSIPRFAEKIKPVPQYIIKDSINIFINHNKAHLKPKLEKALIKLKKQGKLNYNYFRYGITKN